MSEIHNETRIDRPQIGGAVMKQMTGVNRQALNFIFGVQRLLVDETLLAGSEALEQTRAEMHVSAELFSKVAEAHSVETLRAAYLECAQHQMDVLRQSGQQLFKHGQRIVEATSRLFTNTPQS